MQNNVKDITAKLHCLRQKIECLKEEDNEELPEVSGGEDSKDNYRFKEGVA